MTDVMGYPSARERAWSFRIAFSFTTGKVRGRHRIPVICVVSGSRSSRRPAGSRGPGPRVSLSAIFC